METWVCLCTEKYYDADDYIEYSENPTREKRKKLHKKKLITFVQTDELRNLYNSYELIDRLSRTGFVPKISDNYTVNKTFVNVRRKR